MLLDEVYALLEGEVATLLLILERWCLFQLRTSVDVAAFIAQTLANIRAAMIRAILGTLLLRVYLEGGEEGPFLFFKSSNLVFDLPYTLSVFREVLRRQYVHCDRVILDIVLLGLRVEEQPVFRLLLINVLLLLQFDILHVGWNVIERDVLIAVLTARDYSRPERIDCLVLATGTADAATDALLLPLGLRLRGTRLELLRCALIPILHFGLDWYSDFLLIELSLITIELAFKK